ncbi:MAG: hypothetical protein CHACPFDD_02630 [Phycisphaerae bacterium]|nr:hypothetical protein [Phycisphaerae bacterium]
MLNRRRLSAVMLVSAALSAPVWAQSFNVDIEHPDSGWPGDGLPPSSYGAAASQPGYWNAIGAMGQVYTLRDLSGSLTGVTVETIGPGSAVGTDNPNASGDFARLMEDGLRVGNEDADVLLFNIENLAPGRYLVYTYAGLREYGECCGTRVSINFFTNSNVGGYPLPGNTFHQGNYHGYEGGTHARNMVDLPPNVRIQIGIRTNLDGSGQGTITGIQLQKLPERLYVRSAAPDGGDGRTWQTAYNNLQEAMAKIREWEGAVDEMWVAEGAYYPSETDDQYDTFDVLTGMASMYGGFAGDETRFSDRDPAAHPTMLSGNIGGSLPFDNTNTILTMSQNIWGDDDALIDGFVIVGGNSGLDGTNGAGAGLHVYGGDLTMRNCRFISNHAETGAAAYASGGTVRFIDCEFSSNVASSNGGAFAAEALDPNPGPVAKFINCRFHNNDAGFWGGAVDLSSATATFVNCVFTGSDSEFEGGAVHANYSDSTIYLYNCTFAGNRTDNFGAAIGLDSGAQAEIYNSILWDNHGSAAWNNLMKSQLSFDLSSVTASYTTVQFHTPGQLPGAGNNGVNPQFVNSTGGDGYGGLNDDVRLAAGSPLIDAGDNAKTLNDFSDLDQDGNYFEATPLDLDRHARRIDDPATADTGNGTAPIVDRGAYEFSPATSPLGDMNCDGSVNGFDIDPFTLALSDPAGYAAAYPACDINNGDVNVDGSVNGFDIDPFVGLLGG